MEDVSAVAATDFEKNYELHLKHLKLKGLQPKTIEAYSRAIRRIGDYFDHQIDDLSEVEVDLESKHVRFTAPDQSAVDQARRALTRAGYPPN